MGMYILIKGLKIKLNVYFFISELAKNDLFDHLSNWTFIQVKQKNWPP